MFLTYYGYYELWSLFCTSLLALSLMIFLTCLKVHLEGFPCRLSSTAPSAGVGGSGGDSGIIPTKKPSAGRGAAGATPISRAAARDAAAGSSIEAQPLMSSW